MSHQIVSFEIAKALKDVGYPQGLTTNVYLTKETEYLSEGTLMDSFDAIAYMNNTVDAPTAIDVWLWLWRAKRIPVAIKFTYSWIDDKIEDPEDAIISGINHLIDNNLIK